MMARIAMTGLGVSLVCAAAIALGLGACSKEPTPKEQPKVEPAAAGSAAAPGSAPSASAAASAKPAAAQPVCEVKHEKVWFKGATRRTGLTFTRLDDEQTAIGVAQGNTPRVLVVKTQDGSAELLRVPVKAGSDLAKAIPTAEGLRHLQRITPGRDGAGNATSDRSHPDRRRRPRYGGFARRVAHP